MMIHEPDIEIIADRMRLSWRVELESTGAVFAGTGEASEVLWIDWPVDYFRPPRVNGDAALLICFPIAMRLGERIHVDGGVSGALICNVLEAMAIYETYYPGQARAVPLEARANLLDGIETGRVGSFYSGGVDSFFNIAELKRLHEAYGTPAVTDLWLIRGTDIALTDDAMWEQVATRLLSHDHLPETMRLADIHTNARDLHAGIVGWEQMGFSPILGGVAKCFAPMVGQALIGSYDKYDQIAPHASSPLVDPMWSCDNQLVRHFSCRVDRVEKVRTICEVMPEALKVLRVCWQNPEGAYNCGRCEKCLRTQMQLAVLGALDLCPTFDSPLTPETLRHLVIPWKDKSFYTRDFWRDLSERATAAGMEEYARVIDRKLARARERAILDLGRRAATAMPAAVGKRLKAMFGHP